MNEMILYILRIKIVTPEAACSCLHEYMKLTTPHREFPTAKCTCKKKNNNNTNKLKTKKTK